MKYGLTGEHLEYSFSPGIHKELGSFPYELVELSPDELKAFFERRDFDGVNVTIPYKKDVIPLLDEVSEKARSIGAVNTVVKRSDGSLYGDNTDIYGMKYAFLRAGIELHGKKVLILGSGGTSRTALAVTEELGAREVYVVSRQGASAAVGMTDAGEGRCRKISYDEAAGIHADADVIINTTPAGTYPGVDDAPVDLAPFRGLSGVFDVIYNPLRSALLMQAEEFFGKDFPMSNGLPMLVAQAKQASELFRGVVIDEAECGRIYEMLLKRLTNIVLIGMPGSGKSTVGRLVAEMSGRSFIDIDDEIVKADGRDIPQIFADGGEEEFRAIESRVTKEICASNHGAVIACGGGVVTRKENYRALHRNGSIFFIRRKLAELPTGEGRPLSVSPEALREMERVRTPLYENFADTVVENISAEAAAESVLKSF